jgi:mersacidin/lichenicidin family type 2 lantibiotic
MKQERNLLMSELDIIRAWKDKTYRNSLSADQLAQMPEHPAGLIELTDDELAGIDGEAATPATTTTTATATTSVVSIISVISTVITVVSYLSYRAGTNGSAASCCPCQPA